VVGLVALLVSGGNLLLAQRALDTAASERVATAARVERADIYLGFLESADRYHNASAEALLSWADCNAGPGDDPKCGRAFYTKEFLAPRANFQAAMNKVYIYGSADAWAAASLLAGTLPRAVGDLNVC